MKKKLNNHVYKNVTEVKMVLPKGKKITLVGGCFDLLHVGHLHLLEYAASLEEILVVSVLSDDYIKKYKGLERPVISQQQRAQMVASLKCVDYVFVSNTSSSSPEILKTLKPNSVVFNNSTNSTQIRLRLENISLHSPHTKINFLPFYTKERISTSYICDKITNMKN